MKLETILSKIRSMIPKSVFLRLQPYYHWLLAVTGNIRYGFPGNKLIVVGVTGTNGKSTTVELINSVLRTSEIKTGMLSTVAFEVAGKREDNTTSRTTLGRWQLQKRLRQMVYAGCTHVVIEVASEGIVMNRLWGIPFDIAVFTNLSPEHLNTHKTMEKYREAKGMLFAGLSKSRHKSVAKTIIVNADDKQAKYFYHFDAEQKLSFGLSGGEVWATNMVFAEKTQFELIDDSKKQLVISDLPAMFNIYNMLAAYSVGKALGLEPKKIVTGIEKVKLVKGRMEEIENKRGIKIVIDYAVTPDSFELLFTELRRVSKGRIIAVFGATGDRDKDKRPTLGTIAAKMTNYIILTDEESYSENPAVIVDSIAEGVEKIRKSNYEIILDRREALKKAIEVAEPGDTVVATGMGHEKFRNLGGDKKIEWDEANVIREILTELK
jgi:UDP-N-acetylmuramoyl-L-alanyl-D-glutamate--2,6-diaminopimelate ligase